MSTLRSLEPHPLATLQLRMLRVLTVLLLTVCAAQAGAGDARAEMTRDDIARQQRELTARFDADERGCRAQLVVTACVDDVRSRRRAALAPLHDQRLQLDEAQRSVQAEARRAAVAQKQRARAARGAEPPPTATSAPASGPTPRNPWRVPQSTPPLARGEAASTAAAARVLATERRQVQAAAAQARVVARQAEQLKKGKAAAPLPAPVAASAARQ